MFRTRRVGAQPDKETTAETARKEVIVMNTLTSWEPFTQMEDMQNRLSSLFGRAPARRGNGKELAIADWAPLADITEDDKE